MEDTKLGKQEQAVLGEYERALRLGAYELARDIETANQDLQEALKRVKTKLEKEKANV